MEDMVECVHCGQLISLEEAIKIANGDYVCKECLEDDYVECADCGEIFAKDDMTMTDNGLVCKECLENDYSFCENCNSFHNNDDMVEVYDSPWEGDSSRMCSSCAENVASQCSACGNWYRSGISCCDDGDYEGDYLCEDCGSDRGYDFCADCGNYCQCEYNEDDDNYYCSSCAPEHYMNNIHPYGTTELDFYGGHDRTKELHMGYELENSDGTDDMSLMDEQAGDCLAVFKGQAECKEDGSLNNGFEFVSQPATLADHLILGTDKVMAKMIEYGYRSHDAGCCGLHVHVDRRYFAINKEELQDEFEMLFTNNLEWIKRFSRRHDYGYCRISNTEKTSAEDIQITGKPKVKATCARGAINYLNSYTIEFRIFRGTLKYNTFVATLQFVQMFCEFVKTRSLEGLAMVRLHEFIKEAEDKNYKEFLTYLEERKITEETYPAVA